MSGRAFVLWTVVSTCATTAAVGAQQLHFTDGFGGASRVERIDVDGTGGSMLVTSGLNTADGIEVDLAGDKMYWVEQGGRVRRADLDGSNVQTLFNAGGTPHGVDIDLLAGKVYWSEIAGNRIRRANLDGTSVETVINPGGADGLAVDAPGGKIYWTQGNDIRRANLNGTGNELLFNSTGPHGVALDPDAGLVYWTGLGDSRIYRGNMDGSGSAQILVNGASSAVDVTLDLVAGKMYWTELGSGGRIRRANLDGSSVQLVTAAVTAPLGISLRHPGVPFCLGSSGCPCGNDDAGGGGCRHSAGTGAVMTGSGTPSVAADDLTLTIDDIPSPNANGIVFVGPNILPPFVPTSADGFACTGGGLRFPGILDDGVLPNQLVQPNVVGVAAANGFLIASGDTWHFQGWFRDNNGSPCGGSSNLSNGYSVTFVP